MRPRGVCVCTCTCMYKHEPPENGCEPSQQPEKAELDRIRIKPELLGHLNLHAATQLSGDARRTACIRGSIGAGRRPRGWLRVDAKWHLVTVEALQPLELIAG